MNYRYEYTGQMPASVLADLHLLFVPYDYDPACNTITLRHVDQHEKEAFENSCAQAGFKLGMAIPCEYKITDKL